MPDRAAVLGTGIMGAPMARNLLKAGFQVRVWNRTPDKARVLAAEGAGLAETPADAVREAAFVITTVRLEPEAGRVTRTKLVANAWTVALVETLRAQISRAARRA
jgi:2-hydroxy-3-oxopropionate reductase